MGHAQARGVSLQSLVNNIMYGTRQSFSLVFLHSPCVMMMVRESTRMERSSRGSIGGVSWEEARQQFVVSYVLLIKRSEMNWTGFHGCRCLLLQGTEETIIVDIHEDRKRMLNTHSLTQRRYQWMRWC